MKLTANAQQVAAEILEAFKSGAVPKALAQTFLTRHLDSPCSRWSWRNRLIVALRGHADARGFRQWHQVGRHVRAGAKAFLILGPMVARSRGGNEAEDPGDDREGDGGLKIIGFRGIAVFGYNQTEGEPLPALDRAAAFLETLPLLEVAHLWGLVVKAIAPGGGRLGYYLSGIEIGLAVENLSTWTHELVHHAAFRIMPTWGPLRPFGSSFEEVPSRHNREQFRAGRIIAMRAGLGCRFDAAASLERGDHA